MTTLTVRQQLRKRLTEGGMVVAPGIYDAYGARMVEKAGFEAVYMTGNGVSACLLGQPDVGMVDLSPDQDENEKVKTQLLNFRTGNLIPLEVTQKPELELSKREIEILGLVKKGYLSKEISDKLSISVHTVNTHRQRFLEKLGANNSIEAVMFASKFGLLD